MSTSNKTETLNLAKYVYYATKLRDENDIKIFELVRWTIKRKIFISFSLNFVNLTIQCLVHYRICICRLEAMYVA